MKPRDAISDIQLNSFIDNELHDDEKKLVLDAIEQDEDLARDIAELRQDMNLLKIVYQNPPLPTNESNSFYFKTGIDRAKLSIAASLFLALGIALGWFISPHQFEQTQPVFSAVDTLPSQVATSERVLIHISEMDDTRIRAALDKAEDLLDHSNQSHTELQLEVIANADGLAMLRKSSPYKARIQSLKQQYPNLKFKACGISIENTRLKEGKDVELLPEAQKIPAALTDILQKLKSGWVYVKS